MKKLLFLAGILLVFLSCAKDEIKPPSVESDMALEAFSLAESMRSAYENKDFEGLAAYCTSSGYEEIRAAIKEFDSVELTFTPRLVEVKNLTDEPEAFKVTLNVSWEGKWILKDTVKKERAMAVFELVGKPLKLNRILRGSPFKSPE